MAVVLYGRDPERAQIGALLEGARASRSGALVLRGEVGIGKSALLEDARERAGDMLILTARGVESEAELPFAGLHQLLRPALGHVERLPPPQAAALRSALGLEESAGHERFLVFAACLSLLSELAERRPVLCVVDDAHWLDAASADALRFVARRLDAEGIALIFAAREGDVRAFEADDVASLNLSGLDADAADILLSRGAVRVGPEVRERLVARTRGNALALVELPSVLTESQLAGAEPLPEALPMTQQLETVFYERVGRLPEEAGRFLLVAAADDTQDIGVMTRAAQVLGVDLRGLGAAEEAGLVVVHGARLEFRHPLIRSAVYGAATSGERRDAHRALAAALAGDGERDDRRAWHLASAALEYDVDVVRALDDAAARAEERAAHIAAARALERAAELSPDVVSRGARLARAARNLSLAGRDEQAVVRANQASPLVFDPILRAELAQVHGLAAIRSGRPPDVVAVLVDAAREVASLEPARAIELLTDASIAAWQGGDRDQYLGVARLAATIVPAPNDEVSWLLINSFAGFEAMIEGDRTTGVPLLDEVAAWGATAEESPHVLWASFASLWLGDSARFGALVERAGLLARQRGEVGILTEALGHRAFHLALLNRFDDASIAASEGARLARELGAKNLELLPRGTLAIIAAVRGQDEEARRHGEEVLAHATANGMRLRASIAVYALALADLGRADWPEALARLESLMEGGAAQLDPLAAATTPDRIEAAVKAGRQEIAQAALPQLEARAAYAGARQMQPRLAACRALLAEGDAASDHFEDALRLGAEGRPFDLARIQLLYGEHLRRERRRTDARLQLRAALKGFERLQAEPWAERTRVELRASGETARKRDPSAISQLTPQELQVARYVAEGLSNKAIAAQLFLSPRTIDSHLRNVFAKLGITSRTQLARLPLADEEAVRPLGTASPA